LTTSGNVHIHIDVNQKVVPAQAIRLGFSINSPMQIRSLRLSINPQPQRPMPIGPMKSWPLVPAMSGEGFCLRQSNGNATNGVSIAMHKSNAQKQCTNAMQESNPTPSGCPINPVSMPSSALVCCTSRLKNAWYHVHHCCVRVEPKSLLLKVLFVYTYSLIYVRCCCCCCCCWVALESWCFRELISSCILLILCSRFVTYAQILSGLVNIGFEGSPLPCPECAWLDRLVL